MTKSPKDWTNFFFLVDEISNLIAIMSIYGKRWSGYAKFNLFNEKNDGISLFKDYGIL